MERRPRIFWICCVMLAFAVNHKNVVAEEYLRISKDNQGYPKSLDTAVVQFSGNYKGHSLQIDLIAALHVAEKSYYQDLNNLFKQYDSLLYELVAPKGTKLDQTAIKDKSTVSGIQKQLQNLLGLSFQLEEINYIAPNFIHADFTPEELLNAMRSQKDALITTLARVLAVSVNQANTDEAAADNFSLFLQLMQKQSKKREIKIRRIFARQFNSADKLIDAINGPTGSAIIEGRNQKALSVLRNEINSEKKRIGIFYGAGHLSGLESALVKSLKMRKVHVLWLEAWDLRLPQ